MFEKKLVLSHLGGVYLWRSARIRTKEQPLANGTDSFWGSKLTLNDLIGHLDNRAFLSISQFLDQSVDRFFIDWTVVLVPNLQDRGSVAGIKTFNLFKHKHAVCCSLSVVNAKFLRNVIPHSKGTIEMAREACTHFNLMATRMMLGVVH